MLLTIFSFIVVLTFIVFVHESGHFLAARHVGVRVQRFSIGFPPRMIGKTVGETEYMISWLPLGGYVRLEGQNLDDENPNDPRNYASKTKLQRLYILAAGPAMNLVLALLVMPLVFMLGVETPRYRLEAPVLAQVAHGSPAQEAGFSVGDRITALDGQAQPSWETLERAIGMESTRRGTLDFSVVRAGQAVQVHVPSSAMLSSAPFGWTPLVQPVVGYVAPGSASREAGLQPGDRVVSISGEAVSQWDQMPDLIQKGHGQPLTMVIERAGQRRQVQLTPKHEGGSWVVGISPGSITERYSALESVRLGTQRLVDITGATFTFLGRLLVGKGSLDALGGPVKIGVVIGEAAHSGFDKVLFLIAVISLQLGIFNLLPIPALDGGHIFLLAVELVLGGPLSAKVRERAQIIGVSLLIALILVVTYNDVMQLIS